MTLFRSQTALIYITLVLVAACLTLYFSGVWWAIPLGIVIAGLVITITEALKESQRRWWKIIVSLAAVIFGGFETVNGYLENHRLKAASAPNLLQLMEYSSYVDGLFSIRDRAFPEGYHLELIRFSGTKTDQPLGPLKLRLSIPYTGDSRIAYAEVTGAGTRKADQLSVSSDSTDYQASFTCYNPDFYLWVVVTDTVTLTVSGNRGLAETAISVPSNWCRPGSECVLQFFREAVRQFKQRQALKDRDSF